MKFNPIAESLLSYPQAELAAVKRDLQERGIKVYDFGTGDPIEPTADFIRQAAKESVPEISQYPTVRGTVSLRRAISAYLKRRFSVELNPDSEIIQATGSKESVYNLPFLMIDSKGDKNIVISPAPGYSVMERGSVMAGAHYYPFYLNDDNGYMVDLERLSPDVLSKTALAWINYPHNPTGVVCDLDYLKRQVQICQQYDILLCSDECYIDVYFDDVPPPSILQVTTTGVLAFHSCSKRSGMTAYRTGFIAGDKTVIDHYAKFRDNLGVATPIYTQAAAERAWSDDQHVLERRKLFKEKRDLIISFLNKGSFEFTKTPATFYLWVRSPRGLTGKEYALQLAKHGIIVSPGEYFAKSAQEHFRIALVPSLADCEAATRIWPVL